jgi:RecA/RadA recombinase
MVKAKDAEQAMLARTEREPPVPPEDMLSTGSTLINLALTGTTKGGYSKGRYFPYIGDSGSGKTSLILSAFAEAARNPEFDDYQLVYDDGEGGALDSLTGLYGRKMIDRLDHWNVTKGTAASRTSEEMYDRMEAAMERGPVLYIRDSMDALSSTAEEKAVDKARKARGTAKEKGVMSDGKAKVNSSRLRVINNKLQETKSIFISVGQTRDNMGFGAMFNPKVYSGGNSIKFYATCEIWTSVVGAIKRPSKGKDWKVGVYVRVTPKKNRYSGKEWSVKVPILIEHGIDDIGSMVDFLADYGHWKGTENTVEAPDLSFKGPKEKLIRQVQDGNQEGRLRKLVRRLWREIEADTHIERKPRYE